eukprot:742013-Pelagomonas_calceolata.AAC.1
MGCPCGGNSHSSPCLVCKSHDLAAEALQGAGWGLRLQRVHVSGGAVVVFVAALLRVLRGAAAFFLC